MRRVAVWTSLALSCSRPPEPAQIAEPRAVRPALASAVAPTRASTAKAPSTPSAPPAASAAPLPTASACGSPDCLAFESPEAAFEHVLARAPRVLAIGEAHAQKGSERIQSATDRFSTLLLPRLAGRASDIVIELMIANGQCRKTEQQVKRQTEAVTQNQTATAKNAFVELGHRAKALRIEPHPLIPSCEEYAAITRQGENDIAALLELVARVTLRELTGLLSKPGSSLIVSYGGAIHNDVAPRPGREAWSFGPELLSRASYLELDLIVPEYVKDTEAWRALPWYDAFARAPRSAATRLFATGPRSYALVFASSPPP